MTKAAENQLCPSSSLCFFRNYLLYVSVLVLFLVFITVFSSSIFSSVLCFTVFILSTVFLFKFTKRNPGFEENLVKDKQENLPEDEEIFWEPQLKNEPKKETQVGVCQIHDYLLAKSSDLSSETESGDISFSSEDSDADWSFRNDVGQFQMFSDDSISDDDSLIEIELPGGHYIGAKEEPKVKMELLGDHYIGAKEEPNKFKFQTKLPELFQESIFGKEDLMELLTVINEMNEEENLIEIDISMGSIKCSRLEIEA